MQKSKSKSGHIYYKATSNEIALLGGFGICDHCNKFANNGFLVPILNHYMCKNCFDEWDSRATYYPEDTYIEAKRASYYEAMIPMDEVN